MFGGNGYLCIMKNIEYIAIKNDGVLNRMFDLGYEWYVTRPHDSVIDYCKYDKYIFICLNGGYYGELIDGEYDVDYDYIVDIEDIPLQKDFDKWIEVLKEGTKLGLL